MVISGAGSAGKAFLRSVVPVQRTPPPSGVPTRPVYAPPMFSLERLRADHIPALLAFETENRAYFARTVPDRGDDYFREFEARLAGLLAEQEDGVCHFHVLVSGAEVVGRVNLVDVADGAAELGYRVGERWSGRGVATRGVAEVCRLAKEAYGLRGLFAGADAGNTASRTVLERNGTGRFWQVLVQDPDPRAVAALRGSTGVSDFEDAPVSLEEVYAALMARSVNGAAVPLVRKVDHI